MHVDKKQINNLKKKGTGVLFKTKEKKCIFAAI